VNFCNEGTCAIRQGDCACAECAEANLCVGDVCTETGDACASDDDCPSANFCVRSFLFAVEGGAAPTSVWRVPLDSTIGTASPAIDGDGAIYIGTESGVLRRISQ
jgi:hypothetical protein